MYTVAAGGGEEGHTPPAALSTWRHFKGYKNRYPSTRGVLQTFKKQQIHFRPGLRPRLHAGELPTLYIVGWDLGQGGATGRTFAPGATVLGLSCILLSYVLNVFIVVVLLLTVV